MGNTTSNAPIANILTLEEAIHRLTPEEYAHLKSSYEQLMSPPNKENFTKKAMIGFPIKFSEQLYSVVGGQQNDVLSFNSVLCGLVILIRGSRQEKLQLLYYMMCGDGQKLTQEGMQNSLQAWGIEPPVNIDFLFTVSTTCSFQHFNKWFIKFSPQFGVFDWILDSTKSAGFICTGKHGVFSTYHKFLSEQASFTEKQVMALEKHYSKLRKHFSRSKKFDLDALYNCLHPLYSYEFTQHFFTAFDLNNDGNIDSRELVIGLSMILESEDSFAKFLFSMFDDNDDGLLKQEELNTLSRLISSFCMVTDPLKLLDPPTVDINLDDFIAWCNNNCSMYKFHSHLKNIVYMVFGVKPDLTFNIIRQWMEMESDMKLITGKAYYIANNDWFKGTGGPVNNTPILEPDTNNGTKNIPVITTEGGTLRKGLIHGVDYQIISPVLWFTLEDWYGCDVPICRRAGPTSTGSVVIQLFPIKLNFYRQPSNNTRSAVEALASGFQAINIKSSFEGSVVAMDPPRHVLSYVGAFYGDDSVPTIIQLLSAKLKLGREDLRLWKMNGPGKLQLLDDTDDKTLGVLNFKTSTNILIEVRNFDMSWPEEVANIIHQNRLIDRRAPTARVNGTTGLNNLGNTCFMNSGVQCLSNTRALTVYFLKELHLHELNQDNPDSLNGLLALRYANLIKNLWSGTSRTIAPLKMRWTISKFATQFNGFGQHDAQELLAFLLDGLHEDLNRVTVKPYTQINDSGNRPDSEVAEEFWNNHAARNRSIIVDLFHGQLKSTLKCLTCGFTSVRFDPFSSLSLPLPENENVIIEVFVVRLDPAKTTTKYCLWLNNEYTMAIVHKKLREKCPDVENFLCTDLENNTIVNRIIGSDEPLHKINFPLYAFELPGSKSKPEDYIIVYSRHYVTVEQYLFAWQHRQVELFGTPFIVPTAKVEGQDQTVTIIQRIRDHLVGMYAFDDEFAEDLLFSVRKVKQNGRDCCLCVWKERCYGCKLSQSPDLGECGYVTVDWSSAVVHLIRQYDDDIPIFEDSSVADAKQRQSQPIDLSTCLNNFTKEEELSGEWYCEKCGCHRNALKKLDIWRLPPILIIHLKRFSFQGGKWVKCHRTVKFPVSFDPTPFLVKSNQVSMKKRLRTESVNYLNTVLVERVVGGDDYDEVSIKSIDDDEVVNSNNRNPLEQHKNSLSYITNSMRAISKKKVNDDRPFYDLFAVTAHTGHIGHGHYVGFALNPNLQWYYYNDSQVKKTTKKRVLSEPAYILFYERRNLKLDDLLPSYNSSIDQSFDFDASVIMKDALHAADKKPCFVQ